MSYLNNSQTLKAIDATTSIGNSSLIPLGANATFVGEWESTVGFASIEVLLRTDQPYTFYSEFSIDGIITDRSFPSAIIAPDPASGTKFTVGVTGQYWRLRVVNGTTPQTSFRLQSIFSPVVTEPGAGPLFLGMGRNTSTQAHRTAGFGQRPDGTYFPVQLALDGSTLINGAVSVSNFPATQPVSGTVAVNNFPSSQAVTGTFWQATQPVSAVALPLPTGASTEATLAAIKAKTDNLDVALSTRTKPSDTQSVSASSWPLPTGAATSTLQTTGNTSLSSIDTRLATVTSNQSTELTNQTTIINRLSGWPTMLPNSCVPVQSLVTGINLPSAGISYLLAAVRKKSGVSNFVRVKGYEGAIKTNDFIKFALVVNPTIAGSLSFADVANTPFQSVVGVITNLVTLGREIDCTYASLNMQNYKTVENGLSQLGATDVIALVGIPALGSASVNVTAYMNVEWV